MLFTHKTIKELKAPENGMAVGEFVNKLIPFGILGDSTENQIRELIMQQGCMLAPQEPRHHDSAIPGGFFEIQWHDHSVSEHTDDVSPPYFFCVLPFETKRISESNFVAPPELVHFGADGKKKYSKLYCGIPVIFNPRKCHSLIYHGEEVKLIIFSVVKFKKQKLV